MRKCKNCGTEWSADVEKCPLCAEFKNLEVGEANQLVRDVAEKVEKLILGEVMKVHPVQRALLMCRIVTFVFSRHFRMMVSSAEQTIDSMRK